MKTFRTVSALLMLAAGCFGQTATDAGQIAAKAGAAGQVLVVIPGTVGARTFSIWAVIDAATLTLDTTTTPPTLRAIAAQPIQFVDSEVPTGAVDGVNVSFTLAFVPNPVGSLQVFRNGLRQKVTFDYNFMGGPTFTFLAVATPQPGDTLLVSYRH
jgi:hypothetical protein